MQFTVPIDGQEFDSAIYPLGIDVRFEVSLNDVRAHIPEIVDFKFTKTMSSLIQMSLGMK